MVDEQQGGLRRTGEHVDVVHVTHVVVQIRAGLGQLWVLQAVEELVFPCPVSKQGRSELHQVDHGVTGVNDLDLAITDAFEVLDATTLYSHWIELGQLNHVIQVGPGH
ncbi:hypothetical protein D3C84_257140 [compost metagenome]